MSRLNGKDLEYFHESSSHGPHVLAPGSRSEAVGAAEFNRLAVHVQFHTDERSDVSMCFTHMGHTLECFETSLSE